MLEPPCCLEKSILFVLPFLTFLLVFNMFLYKPAIASPLSKMLHFIDEICHFAVFTAHILKCVEYFQRHYVASQLNPALSLHNASPVY